MSLHREAGSSGAASRSFVEPCTIGLWGTYDVDNYGDVLFPRIAEMEIAKRLPGATVRFFSPFGAEHPIRFDGGQPAEPLGRWSEARLGELAAELDCVVIGGGEIVHTHYEHFTTVYSVEVAELRARDPARFFVEGLGPDLERDCPVVWHAVGVPFDPSPEEAERLRTSLAGRPYVAVRDHKSKQRLQAAGVQREIVVVPDSAFLLGRLFDPALLQKRLDFLRVMGWYPAEGPALVVQGNRFLVPHVPRLAGALSALLDDQPDLSLVSVQTGPCLGDDQFAEALGRALPGLRYRLPAQVDVADVAAAIAASATFIGISLHGNITALVHGRPHVVLDFVGYSKLDGFAQLIGRPECVATDPEDVPRAFRAASPVGLRALADLERQVDAHFDRIVDIAASAAGNRSVKGGGQADAAPLERRLTALVEQIHLLRRAHEVRGQRLVAERAAFADQVVALRGENLRLEVERDAAAKEASEARQRAEEVTRELERLRLTRTFRYSAPVRGLYRRLRPPSP